jgi:hypothetical protein
MKWQKEHHYIVAKPATRRSRVVSSRSSRHLPKANRPQPESPEVDGDPRPPGIPPLSTEPVLLLQQLHTVRNYVAVRVLVRDCDRHGLALPKRDGSDRFLPFR